MANKLRGELAVTLDGKQINLVLDFGKMAELEARLAPQWSLVKIAKTASEEWNLPMKVAMDVLNIAHGTTTFAERYMEEHSILEGVAVAAQIVIRAVTGSADAKKEQASKGEPPGEIAQAEVPVKSS